MWITETRLSKKMQKEEECHADRNTSVAFYGEDKQLKQQVFITINENTLPTKIIEQDFNSLHTLQILNNTITLCYKSSHTELRRELIIHKIHHRDNCKKKKEMKREISRWTLKVYQSARMTPRNLLLQRFQITIYLKPI